MKTCKKCNTDKPPEDYYHGRQPCKKCHIAMVTANYKKNRDYYLAYFKRYWRMYK